MRVTSRLDLILGKRSADPESARYELIGYRVNLRTGEREGSAVVLCPGPFTHAECMTAKSKFTARPDFAITVREITR